MGRSTRTNYGFLVRVDIPHGQILTLPTVPVQLLPAPRPNHLWVAEHMTIWCNPLVVDYGNIEPGAGGFVLLNLASSANFFSGLPFIFSGSPFNQMLGGGVATIEALGGLGALSISVTNGALGNFTNGNAANVLHVELAMLQVEV